jgi:hypothetical protein
MRYKTEKEKTTENLEKSTSSNQFIKIYIFEGIITKGLKLIHPKKQFLAINGEFIEPIKSKKEILVLILLLALISENE